jgi:hypothetical protein
LTKIDKSKGYIEWYQDGERDQHWVREIKKDIDRTYSRHPYFKEENYGKVGQQALLRVLVAYSAYNPKV